MKFWAILILISMSFAPAVFAGGPRIITAALCPFEVDEEYYQHKLATLTAERSRSRLANSKAQEKGIELANDRARLKLKNDYLNFLGFSFVSRDEYTVNKIIEFLKSDYSAAFLDELRKLAPEDQQKIIDQLDFAVRLASDEVYENRPSPSSGRWEGSPSGVTKISYLDFFTKIGKFRQEGESLVAAVSRFKAANQSRIDAVYSAYYREGIEEVFAGDRVVISRENLLPKDAVDQDLPDAIAFRKAKIAARLRIRNPKLKYLTASEKRTLNRLANAYQPTIDSHYVGRNAVLKTLLYRERNDPGAVYGTIDKFVQNTSYSRENRWWSTREQFTAINQNTSESFVRKVYGETPFKRIPYWPLLPGSRVPDTSQFHIALNSGADGRESLEVFYNTGSESEPNWIPFMYENFDGVWIPKNYVQLPGGKRITIDQKCMQCHYMNGRFSPIPAHLKTVGDFHRVGYLDDTVIEQLMRHR